MSMGDRFVITIYGDTWFAGHARPSDAGLPYAQTAEAAVRMVNAGASRVQIDADLETARAIKAALQMGGAIR